MREFQLFQPHSGASFWFQCPTQKVTAEQQMQALRGGRHALKPLQAAYNADPRGWLVRVYETPGDRERLRQADERMDQRAKRGG